MSADDDAAWATRALAGEQAAFTALVQRHRDPLYRLVRGYVGDADVALDVVQESFAAAFLALGRYDPARPFRPWLSRIALNKCRDWSRRRAVRRFLTFARPLDEALAQPDAAPAPDIVAADRAALDKAMRAIAALPDSLKAPLLLCAVEGLSQAETAAILGTSGKAVELRLRRARAALADRLERGADDGAA